MSKPTVQSYAEEARNPRLNHIRSAVKTGKWRVGDSKSTVCPSSRSALARTEMPTKVPLPRVMSCGVEVRKRNLKVSESPGYPPAGYWCRRWPRWCWPDMLAAIDIHGQAGRHRPGRRTGYGAIAYLLLSLTRIIALGCGEVHWNERWKKLYVY